MARHTKTIQGLLQNLTFSLESTMSPLSTRISLSASTSATDDLQCPKLSRQPLGWLVPRFLTKKVEKSVPVADESAVRALERALGVEHACPAFELFNVAGTSQHSAQFLSSSSVPKGCLP